MQVKTILTIGLMSFSTVLMAWPSKEETAKVTSVVQDLMRPEQEALKEGRKSRSEVAAVAAELSRQADSEAAKLLLLKGAFNLYVRDGAFDKAIGTLKTLRTTIPDLPAENMAIIIEGALRRVQKKNGGQLYQLLDETKMFVRYQNELASLTVQAKKNAREKSVQLKIAEHQVVLGDWTKALDAFAQSSDRKAAEIAKAEKDGARDPKTIADFWWSYPDKKADELEKGFKLHAAMLYSAALTSGNLSGLNKVQVERRIEEAKSLGELFYKKEVAVTDKLYCVIDLAGGPNAMRYPVSYLSAVPKGGWTDEYKTTKLVLRKIEPGCFLMGDSLRKPNECVQEKIDRAYYIGVFEVSQRQWELVVGDRPAYFRNDNFYATRPIENISYKKIRGEREGMKWPLSKAVDPNSFMGRLRSKTNIYFDLPTETQWEYACRAGTTTDFCNNVNWIEGGMFKSADALCRHRLNGGWSESDFGKFNGQTFMRTANRDSSAQLCTARVGSYLPNAWGLFDMHGNVWELVLDWRSERDRCRRGGAWSSVVQFCSSHKQGGIVPYGAEPDIGFRLAIQPEFVPPKESTQNFTPKDAKRKLQEEFAEAKELAEEKVATQKDDKLYCVIDLSGGPNAKNYSVNYLNAVPKGGWTDEYKTTKLVLRKIDPGKFLMGDSVRHVQDCADVVISKGYYIGVFETTQRQWELVMGNRPAWANNTSCYAMRPIEQVSYGSIHGFGHGRQFDEVSSNSFVGELRRKCQMNIDLPTEAQWEFACRAGTTSEYNNGANKVDDSVMGLLGRFAGNALQGENHRTQEIKRQERGLSDEFTTAKVGSYCPNGWGLYDMHGNVGELCLDCPDCISHEDGRASWRTGKLPRGVDPRGTGNEQYRVVRGGCWSDPAKSCVSSSRGFYQANLGRSTIGFRLAIQPRP